MKESWWRRNRPRIASALIYGVAHAIGRSLRFKLVSSERVDRRRPAIYLMWHGRTFIPGQFQRGDGFCVIISHSRDGELQSRIFQRLGYTVIRGSTGRGGERALVESIRALRAGFSMAITPDGPRGPSGVVQPGVLLMAKKSGVPLVPLGSSARRAKIFHSWDRYLVPWPFTTVSFVAGELFHVPADASAEEVEAIRQKVEAEMHRVQGHAEEILGQKPAPACRPDDIKEDDVSLISPH